MSIAGTESWCYLCSHKHKHQIHMKTLIFRLRSLAIGTMLTACSVMAASTVKEGDIEGSIPADSIQLTELEEVVVGSDLKHFSGIEAQPVSAQKLLMASARKTGRETLKALSQLVPNLYYPEYGSRLTPAIYIRGIGSRSNTPVVGLYVDDVALMEKSSFDFSLTDAERVEVLRGPQSTLYGRNAMGGIIRVFTPSPLQEGTQTTIRVGGSTGDWMRNAYARHSHILTEGLGLSVSAFYRGDAGYNRNDYLDTRSNGSEAGGGKVRLTYTRSPRFLLDFQTSAEYSDEHAYDYENTTNGRIESGMLGRYKRGLLNSSLKLETQQKHFTLSSVTAFQYLKDRMDMDQDYSPADIFLLQQRQRSSALSEELVIKGNSLKWLDWTAGAYVAHQWLKTSAPVTFGSDGIHQLIQAGVDKGFEAANQAMARTGMSLAMTVNDTEMVIPGEFNTPVTNAAAYGQARFKNLFTRGLDITAGVRLDYEHRAMDYDCRATSNFTFQMLRRGVPRPMIDKTFSTTSAYEGSMSDDQLRVLPKLAISYRFDDSDDANMVYISAASGLRSGGYNFQMFSDLLQNSLRNDMMRTLAEDPQLAPSMARMTIDENPAAEDYTRYDPETSWNFEVGTHLTFLEQHLNVQAAVFYNLVYDQQVTRFAAGSGLGRQVLNVGQSASCGGELSISGWFPVAGNPLRLSGNYGYTHATFTNYDAGEVNGEAVDYTGNYVPFAPQHTMSFTADYFFPIGAVTMNVGVGTTGMGRIYWTEDNSASQGYYQLLNAHVGMEYKKLTVNIWGNNLTNQNYTPFYFVSRGTGFAQRCRPLQVGLTVGLKF